MSEDAGVLTIAKLRAMVRQMDALVSDDVIAVSMLFPPDKTLEFIDDKGKVYAMGTAFWHRLKAAAVSSGPSPAQNLLGAMSSPLGLPVVFEGDDEVWRLTVQRICRSMEAAVELSEYMKCLLLELKLLGGSR